MSLEVLRVGGPVTIQDTGRPGWAHLGVPRSGALDADAAGLANRVVGNDGSAAVLEVVLGGLALRPDRGHWLAVAGAPCPLRVRGRAQPTGEAFFVPAGAEVEFAPPASGLRTYVAVAGGIDCAPVLGSRSRDTLSGLGPAPLRAGDRLAVGPTVHPPRAHDVPGLLRGDQQVRLWPGPRLDWFADGALEHLCSSSWSVQADSDRVGVRLGGPPLRRVRDDELPSEGMVLGAVQVPPDGQPVVLMHDHPVTGGYPVAAVADPRDLWVLAQARPGELVRFTIRR